MCRVFAAYIARYSELRAYSLLQCELSVLRRNHRTFFAETESLPKVIDQYLAENETCRNRSNCCFRRRNRNRISVSLYISWRPYTDGEYVTNCIMQKLFWAKCFINCKNISTDDELRRPMSRIKVAYFFMGHGVYTVLLLLVLLLLS